MAAPNGDALAISAVAFTDRAPSGRCEVNLYIKSLRCTLPLALKIVEPLDIFLTMIFDELYNADAILNQMVCVNLKLNCNCRPVAPSSCKLF